MRNESYVLLTLAIFACLPINNLDLTLSRLLEEGNAHIVDVKYAAKIQEGKPETLRFIVHNVNCTDDKGDAWFSFKFYLNDEQWWSEYDDTTYKSWQCNKGQTVTRGYNVKVWSANRPITYNLKTELYWHYNRIPHLQDTKYFSIVVTLLIPLSHIYASSYLAVYLLACFTLISYYYYITKVKY